VPHMDYLNALVAGWIIDRPLAEVMETLIGVGVAVAPVYSAADIAVDPHYAAREAIVTVNDPATGPIKQPAPTPKLSRTPGAIYHAAPALGEHNSEIYGGLLGLSAAEIDQLSQTGVI
jgi:formyl-CoA transferase